MYALYVSNTQNQCQIQALQNVFFILLRCTVQNDKCHRQSFHKIYGQFQN